MSVFFDFVGTEQQLTVTIVNPYTGEEIDIDEQKNVNEEIYIGTPGVNDTLIFTNIGDAIFMTDPFAPLASGSLSALLSPGFPFLESVETFAAGDGDDLLVLSDSFYTLEDTTIFAGSGNDIIWANIGNDEVWGENGNDIINGGPGIDTITGGNDNDYVRGGADNDDVDGDDGDDRVVGDTGTDDVNGGDGDDLVIGHTENVGDNDFDGTVTGLDFLSWQRNFGSTGINNAADTNQDGSVNGADLLDWASNYGTTYAADTEADTLSGGAGDDTLADTGGTNTFNFGEGTDELYLGADIDTIIYDFYDSFTDTINYFEAGVGGDVLDISNILSGYTPGNELDFVGLGTAGNGDTTLLIDANGTSGGVNFVTAAVFDADLDTTIADLINNGNLIL